MIKKNMKIFQINNIISCYSEVKIWEKNIKENSYQNITILKDSHFIFSLLFIQENKNFFGEEFLFGNQTNIF